MITILKVFNKKKIYSQNSKKNTNSRFDGTQNSLLLQACTSGVTSVTDNGSKPTVICT